MGADCCKGPADEGTRLDSNDPALDNKVAVRKVSRNTLMTNEQLVETLAAAAAESGAPDPAATGATGGRTVMINVEVIETLLFHTDEDGADADSEMLPASSGSKRSPKGRKGTGYVTKEQVDKAIPKVNFAPEDDEQPVEERGRVRKPTGFVTKEKLLQALQDMDSDEEDEDEVPAAPAAKVAPALPPAQTASGEPMPKIAPAPKDKDRKQVRKGTGFVSKSKLQKVLAMFGETE